MTYDNAWAAQLQVGNEVILSYSYHQYVYNCLLRKPAFSMFCMFKAHIIFAAWPIFQDLIELTLLGDASSHRYANDDGLPTSYFPTFDMRRI